MSYTAFKLDVGSREKLLAAFPPKYPEVIAHHVTVQFGVPKGMQIETGYSQVVEVIGYAEDDGIEAAVVRVNGTSTRKDGSVYHVTLSLDRSKGRKPVDSNKVIKENGWIKVQPFNINTTFELLD